MKDWIFTDINSLLQVFVSTVFVFSVLLIFVRISGLRSFAKISAIDFASTIAIGSVLASTLMSAEPSILKGGFAVGSILLFQSIFSKLTLKFDWLNKIANNQPLMLMNGSEILYDNLHAANLSEGDLMTKLREANVIQLSEVKVVILETTGDVSVLHGESDKTVSEILLKNVRKKI